MKAFIQNTTFGLFLYLPFLIAGNLQAQTPTAENARERVTNAVQKLRLACGDDVTKYCSTVTPGEGRLLFCMMAHEDKISTKCDYALYSAARNLDRAIDFIEQAADACWSDIEKLCADVPEGWRSHRTMHAYQKIDRKPRLSEDIGSVAGSEIAGNWHEHLRKLGI